MSYSGPLKMLYANVLSRRDPAKPLMTVTGFLESVQNCSRTGEKASLLLSNCKEEGGKFISAGNRCASTLFLALCVLVKTHRLAAKTKGSRSLQLQTTTRGQLR